MTQYMIRKVAATIKNIECRKTFWSMGESHQRIYTLPQKEYAITLALESGNRGTERILKICRRTLQRWERKKGVFVTRVPAWMAGWVCRRKMNKEFWKTVRERETKEEMAISATKKDMCVRVIKWKQRETISLNKMAEH